MHFAGLTAALALTMAVPLTAAMAAEPAPAQATAGARQAEFAAAEANVSRIRARPVWLSGAQPEFPEAERAAGHHGEVLIVGILGVDGRLRYAEVASSSGAPGLDALALAAAATAQFEPAKDADGAAIAIPMSMPQTFYAYRSANSYDGLVRYSCRQFVADMDWWRATFPDVKWSEHELYSTMFEVGVMGGSGFSQNTGAQLFAKMVDFERRWNVAIAKCRAKPDKRLVDMLQPEGRLAERLSKPR